MDLTQETINNEHENLQSWEEVRRDFNMLCEKLYNLVKNGPVPVDEGLCQWPLNENSSMEGCGNEILDTATELKLVADHISKVGMVLLRMLIVAKDKSVEELENSYEQMFAKLQAADTAVRTMDLSLQAVGAGDTALPSYSSLSSIDKLKFSRDWGSGLKTPYRGALAKAKNRQKLNNLSTKVKEMLIELEAVETKKNSTRVASTDIPMDLSINEALFPMELPPIIEPIPLDVNMVKSVTTRGRGRPPREKLSGGQKTLHKGVQPKVMTDEQNGRLLILMNEVAELNVNETAVNTEKVSPPEGAAATKLTSPDNQSLQVDKHPSPLPITSIVLHKSSGCNKVRSGAPRGRGRPSRAKYPGKNSMRFLKKVKKNACAKPMTGEQIYKLTMKLKNLNIDQVEQLVELIAELEPEYKRQNNANGSATYDFLFFQPATLHHIKRFTNACLRIAKKIAEQQRAQEIRTDHDGSGNMKYRGDIGTEIVNSEETTRKVKEHSCSGLNVAEVRRPTRKQTHGQFFKWKKLSDSSDSSDDSD